MTPAGSLFSALYICPRNPRALLAACEEKTAAEHAGSLRVIYYERADLKEAGANGTARHPFEKREVGLKVMLVALCRKVQGALASTLTDLVFFVLYTTLVSLSAPSSVSRNVPSHIKRLGGSAVDCAGAGCAVGVLSVRSYLGSLCPACCFFVFSPAQR